ncbi:hypothetical protein EDB86DRAFT_2828046 [Lactarius hatsudake]|nr:hypothetical protein EDB86DRAFT_2828046 [Lactarius hatsudake]
MLGVYLVLMRIALAGGPLFRTENLRWKSKACKHTKHQSASSPSASQNRLGRRKARMLQTSGGGVDETIRSEGDVSQHQKTGREDREVERGVEGGICEVQQLLCEEFGVIVDVVSVQVTITMVFGDLFPTPLLRVVNGLAPWLMPRTTRVTHLHVIVIVVVAHPACLRRLGGIPAEAHAKSKVDSILLLSKKGEETALTCEIKMWTGVREMYQYSWWSRCDSVDIDVVVERPELLRLMWDHACN